MVRGFTLATLLIIGSSTLFGQLLPDRLDGLPAHVHPSAGMIDGSKNPEKIPDSTAYRLVLITVAEVLNPTEEQKNRQLSFLKTAGLADNDIQAAIPVLARFKTQYADLINQYNKSVVEANKAGETPDLATFLRQRDELVQSTRDALGHAVSLNGMLNFHAHVQREKSRMSIVAKEGQ